MVGTLFTGGCLAGTLASTHWMPETSPQPSCNQNCLQMLLSVSWQWKWRLLSPVQLCDPRGYTVHGTLQAGILQWVAFPFSTGSSQPRNRTRVFCIAGRSFTNWAIREVSQQEWGQIHNQLKTPGLQSERLGFKFHLFHLLICKIRINMRQLKEFGGTFKG